MANISAEEFFGPTGIPRQKTFAPSMNVQAKDFFGPEGPVEPLEEEKLNFLQRLSNDLQRREELATEIKQAVEAGEQSYAEGILQSAGKVGAGAALDFLGEVIISAGRGLSAITPDIIENPMKDAVTSAGHAFLNTPVGQAGLNAAKKGAEEWFEFKEENPRAARNIEAVVNIGMILTPAKGKPAKPAEPTVFGKGAIGLAEKAEEQIFKTKKEFVDDLVKPKLTTGTKTEQVSRAKEVGILNTRQIELDPLEKQMAEEVAKLPVTPKRSLTHNHGIIAKEVSKEADKLKTALEKNDVVIPKKQLLSALDDAKARLKENPTIVGDAEKTAEKIMIKMRQIVDKNKGTASGVLQSRKDLDSWMRQQKGKNIFDPKNENALSIALREIRQTINDFLELNAPNVAVKQSLQKQSRLLGAMERIASKAADEAGNAAFRLWQKALRIMPVKAEFNQFLALTFGIGGLGAAATFAPFLTKLTFGGLGTYFTGKVLLGPQVKKGLAGLLKLTDRAIRTTKDKNLIRELRLDRALVLELVKEAQEE